MNATSLNKWTTGRGNHCRINTAYTAYENFYKDKPPNPERTLEEALNLILQEYVFQFNKHNYF